MILNNLSQQFTISFDFNSFYPEVEELWMPILKKNGYPWLTIEDFVAGQIQSLDFPGFNAQNVTQQIGHYKNTKRTGFELDAQMEKNISITFKLSESYITYFILRQQFELYLKYYSVKDLYWNPIRMSLLDDAGFETITYSFNQITPSSISNISLSYAARVSQYNTFSMAFAYNFFDIWYRDPVNSKLERIGTSLGSLDEYRDQGNLNLSNLKENKTYLFKN